MDGNEEPGWLPSARNDALRRDRERNFFMTGVSISNMSRAHSRDQSECLDVLRSGLSFEQVRLCLTRLESRQVDCVIGQIDAHGAAPAIHLAADRWWIAVPPHQRSAAAELIAILERAPVRLVRRDVTWKYACAFSMLIMPLNYFLVLGNAASLLTMAATALMIGVGALYGHHCATFVCSDPDCQAVNEPTAEWCCRCGARIGDGVDAPVLGPADADARMSAPDEQPKKSGAIAGAYRAVWRRVRPDWIN